MTQRNAVKNIFTYLAGTKEWDIMFKDSNVKSFVKYCDSDLAEDIDTSVAAT